MDEAKARAELNRFVLDDDALSRLDRLAAMLLDANQQQNLISRASEAELWSRHLLDSAQLLRFAPDARELHWVDIGAGPGLPGLVIAALRPAWQVTLVEPRRQRCEFMVSVKDELGLNGVAVVQSKIEHAEIAPANVISARAVATIERLLGMGAPISNDATLWLLHRGRNAVKEIEELSPNLRRMFHVEQSLTSAESGIVIGQGRPHWERRQR